MDNSQQELINDFVLESREHLAQLEPDLLSLESGSENTDPTIINRIFRSGKNQQSQPLDGKPVDEATRW